MNLKLWRGRQGHISTWHWYFTSATVPSHHVVDGHESSLRYAIGRKKNYKEHCLNMTLKKNPFLNPSLSSLISPRVPSYYTFSQTELSCNCPNLPYSLRNSASLTLSLLSPPAWIRCPFLVHLQLPDGSWYLPQCIAIACLPTVIHTGTCRAKTDLFLFYANTLPRLLPRYVA